MSERKKSSTNGKTSKKTPTKKQVNEIAATGKKVAKKIKRFSKTQKIVLFVIVVALITALLTACFYYKDALLGWFQTLNQKAKPEKDTGAEENGDDIGEGTPSADGRFAVDGYYGDKNYGDFVTLTDTAVSIYFVNVGQGSALFIIFDDGTTMLTDAGNTASAGYINKKAAETNLINLLVSLQIADIDFMLATHPDADHVNLLGNVLDRFQVNTVIYNDIPASGTTAPYNTFRDKALNEPNSKQIKIGATGFLEDYDKDDSKTTETISGGETSVTMYAPGYNNTAAGFSSYKNDKNSMSPICILNYKSERVLFTGDSTTTTETWFLNLIRNKPAANYDVDVLFVGHHGSNTSSSEAFLNFIKAEYAVISAGAGNGFSHPTASTMNKLKALGTVTYRTDTHGTISLLLDTANNFGFRTETDAFTFNNTKGIPDNRLAA